MAYFAVTRERGPRWSPSLPMREQARWDDHAAFMDGLLDEGVIVLGGPIGKGDRRFLLIFDADNEEAIEARLAEDPWTPMEMLRVASVEPWEILLGRPTHRQRGLTTNSADPRRRDPSSRGSQE